MWCKFISICTVHVVIWPQQQTSSSAIAYPAIFPAWGHCVWWAALPQPQPCKVWLRYFPRQHDAYIVGFLFILNWCYRALWWYLMWLMPLSINQSNFYSANIPDEARLSAGWSSHRLTDLHCPVSCTPCGRYMCMTCSGTFSLLSSNLRDHPIETQCSIYSVPPFP